jgi:hypothetical protein
VAIVRVVEPSDRDAGVERARSGVVDIATFKLGTK